MVDKSLCTKLETSGWKKISDYVQQFDYCCGCGVCAGVCPTEALEMEFNEYGSYRPYLKGKCIECGLCAKVCPFIDTNPNEDALAKMIYDDKNTNHTSETGFFLTNYVGCVADPEHRWKGASGGMASWFLKTLLKEKIVDHVICVVPNSDHRKLFQFAIISNADEIIRSAKSVYYPVELSNVLKTVKKNKGRYALVGLPCVLKAVRLASLNVPKLKKRIVAYAGLTCGQMKSKGFAEILTRKLGTDIQTISKVCFRDKMQGRGRQNFSIIGNNANKTMASMEDIKFYSLAWWTGLFKLKSCNFCDDVFAELADISFMDARLPEYDKITAGTNLIICRSPLSQKILTHYGISMEECKLTEINVEKIIKSQTDIISVKRRLLKYRIWMASKKNNTPPKKRVKKKRPGMFNRLSFLTDEFIRSKSFYSLKDQQAKNNTGIDVFLKKMRFPFFLQKSFKKIKIYKSNILK